MKTASKTKKSVHPQAKPRVRKVKPNEDQVAAGRAAADTCLLAIKRRQAALKRDGENPDRSMLLDRELLAKMLQTRAVHTGAVEAFSVAMLAKGWTVAPRNGTLHTADEWKLVRAKGGVWLTAEFLPQLPDSGPLPPSLPKRSRAAP